MARDALHDRLLAIVESLPGAYEDRPWGEVHCKVAGKIFVGWGRREGGAMSVGFKTDKELQAMLVASDPRFEIAAYVGKHGWVNMKLGETPDWAEVEQFVVDSYRRIAPKKLVKELDAKRGDGGGAPSKAPEPAPASKPASATKRAAKPAKPAKTAPKPAKKTAPARRASTRA
jgi:predicted DNA-binding protein (MmcQ/YjbR family)